MDSNTDMDPKRAREGAKPALKKSGYISLFFHVYRSMFDEDRTLSTTGGDARAGERGGERGGAGGALWERKAAQAQDAARSKRQHLLRDVVLRCSRWQGGGGLGACR